MLKWISKKRIWERKNYKDDFMAVILNIVIKYLFHKHPTSRNFQRKTDPPIILKTIIKYHAALAAQLCKYCTLNQSSPLLPRCAMTEYD
jgi:hypothetical protein